VTDVPRRPAGVGVRALLAAAFAMSVREWRVLVPIVLTVQLPASLAANAIAYKVLPPNDNRALVVGPWIDAILWPIAAGAIIWTVARRDHDAPADYASAMRFGLTNAGRLFKTQLIVTVLELLGLLALVVPGAVLSVRWTLADPVVVLEGAGPRRARTRSATLVRDHFARVAAVATAAVAYTGLVDGLALVPSQLLPAFDTMAGQVVLDVVSVLATVPMTVVFVILYLNLAGD